MTKGRGRMNRNAIKQVADSFLDTGGLRAREVSPNNFLLDVRQPVARLELSSAIQPGVGRLESSASSSGIRPPMSGVTNRPVNTNPSGFVIPEPGTYIATGHVSVSGTPTVELFMSEVLLDGTPVEGTKCPAASNGLGAAFVPVNGLFVATSGQVFNVQVSSRISNIIAVGFEDLMGAPHLNVTVFKLPSDSLAINF